MSELMDRGIIGMPFELAMSSELSRRQLYERAQMVLAERDHLRARLDDPDCPPKHSRRLIAQLRAEVEALRELAAECADYLDYNSMTNIASGSILHRKLRDAAMAAKERE